MQSILPDNRDKGIACVYFDHKNQFESIDILRCLLKEVVIRKDVVSYEIRDLYRSHKLADPIPPLSRAETLRTLENELKAFTCFYCIIDGLDESNETSREDLLGELQQFLPKLRLMVTGRPYANDIPTLYDTYQVLGIRARDSDIELFVKGEIQKDKQFRRRVASDRTLEQLVVDTVVSKADGM